MSVDPQKLRELAYSLSADQRRLLQEGLAVGGSIDPDSLRATLNSPENQEIFRELAADVPAAEAPDGGVPDGGVPDGGVPDGGTTHPPVVEPPLTRW